MGCSNTKSATPQCPSEQVSPPDFHDEYLLGVKLGRGAYAQVHACTKRFYLEEPVEKAVKILDLRGVEAPGVKSAKESAREEADVWKTIGNHPNCVHLCDVFHCKDFSYMVMEKCSIGLFQALEGMPELTERGVGRVFAQMLLGISHCHDVKVVHRDIKPDNFLAGGNNGEDVKLTDFGLSVPLPKKGKIPKEISIGSPAFMSPEMLTLPWYDEKVDVWSFGVIAYVLLFGVYPYMPTRACSDPMKVRSLMKEAIISNVAPPSFKPVQRGLDTAAPERSADAVSMVKALLTREPKERPSARQALDTTWMLSAAQDSHMIGADLPSLRPTLDQAKKLGVTAEFNPAHVTDADPVLKAMQKQPRKVSMTWDERGTGSTESTMATGGTSGTGGSRFSINTIGTLESINEDLIPFGGSKVSIAVRGSTFETTNAIGTLKTINDDEIEVMEAYVVKPCQRSTRARSLSVASV